MSIISKDIAKAVHLLSSDKLVAIPTETVYGLAGNIFSETAVKCIFETKKRPFFNPLIVHVSGANKLKDIALEIPEKAQLLADTFWPGPLTLVLKKQEHIPDLITAGKDTVAIRVPNHPLTLDLLKQLPFPLAAPSANPFGSISPTTATHVEGYFRDTLDMVLDGGPCKNGIESTIIGFDGAQAIMYRLGSIALETIEAVIGTVKVMNKKEVAPHAPGMLDRHYAPMTTTILSNNIEESINNHLGKRIGVLVFEKQIDHLDITEQLVLSTKGDLAEAASNLYDALHQLDKKNLDLIIAEILPEQGLGRSINDRLQRASFSS